MGKTYGYDIWGERSQRQDLLHGQTEHYHYSAASRLTRAKLASGSKATTLSASYDAAGNLKTRKEGNNGSIGDIGYTYGASGHPNRLTSLSVTGSDPGLAGGGLSYDAAGRIESGAGYTVTYDRRGLTQTIGKGGHTASLAYAPDGHRYQLTVDGKTTLYLMGGAFRIVQEANGVIAYRQAIVAGGAMVAQRTTRSDASSGFEYFYRDGLGSPVAFASFTGAGLPPGVAYAPYGRPRDPNNWAVLDTGNPLAAYDTRRGYTGGESLAALGVVVLGARVYVPALGRWLSPDPAGVDSPYVYAGDNPETDIDPTGEINWNSVGKIFEVVAIAAAVYFTDGLVLEYGGTTVEAGAAGGFVAGYAGSGGNLRDGAIGALGGAAMAYFGGLSAFGGTNPTAGQLAEKATMEGFVAGTLSAVATHGRRGSFESGFLGAFAAVVIGNELPAGSNSMETFLAGTAASAVAGGTVARIGGGGFANGAWSAAFQYMFNHALDAAKEAEISFSYKSKGLGKFAQAVKKYNLKRMFANVLPSGHHTINVRLDASLSGQDIDMETPNASTILVNPSALKEPYNILAIDIGHELVHVNEWLTGFYHEGMSSSVLAAGEVRAYTWQINHFSAFHIPPDYQHFYYNEDIKYELEETGN